MCLRSASGSSSSTTSRATLVELDALVCRCGAVLESRHREQLLDEPRRARHAGIESCQRRLAFGRFAGRAERIDLQTQRRERRAQLVCGIRNERALVLERGREPPQQIVERIDQRRHFVGEPCDRQRLGRHRLAAPQTQCQLVQGRERSG